MMTKDNCEKVRIHKALKRFGGFVRYYDTTEPLQQLAAIVSSGPCDDILACCGGGNQALTMLGTASCISSLCVVDINSAQLFILAGKACFLKQKKYLPSFKQLKQDYPGRIKALKRNVCRLERMRFCHVSTGKLITLPKSLTENFSLVMEGEMVVLPKSGPFWQEDMLFISRVCARIDRMRLVHMDVFDSPDHFQRESLDLIYLSDIYWQEKLEYYQFKLARLAGLLRPGGRFITYLDPGDDFMGQGVSPGHMLLQQAGELALKINKDQDSGYLVLERIRRK